MGGVRTGPFKVAPYFPRGYYIAHTDLMDWASRLHKAAWTLKSGNHIMQAIWLQDMAEALSLSRENAAAEEATIKAQMDLDKPAPDYADSAQLEQQTNNELLKAAGLNG
jgi:hypothetical protein